MQNESVLKHIRFFRSVTRLNSVSNSFAASRSSRGTGGEATGKMPVVPVGGFAAIPFGAQNLLLDDALAQ